ncbi:MAG TPA: hypothetical protein ENK73_02970 [Thiomicrospira sp.]|nr:hypothetical protein [Thiomicrospira sp.]
MSTLSPNTIEIVKATAAPLKENGEKITSRMYEILFSKYPETKELFSEADHQPSKLANAVIAYAQNIEHLEKLGGAIEQIAAKHVETLVKPEHYPLVGESLLVAIKEVLGDAATDEVINAWSEAYFFLGDILIHREEEMYAEQA